MTLEIIQAIAAGLSAGAAVLAWWAKLNWSEEFKEAKKAEIDALKLGNSEVSRVHQKLVEAKNAELETKDGMIAVKEDALKSLKFSHEAEINALKQGNASQKQSYEQRIEGLNERIAQYEKFASNRAVEQLEATIIFNDEKIVSLEQTIKTLKADLEKREDIIEHLKQKIGSDDVNLQALTVEAEEQNALIPKLEAELEESKQISEALKGDAEKTPSDLVETFNKRMKSNDEFFKHLLIRGLDKYGVVSPQSAYRLHTAASSIAQISKNIETNAGLIEKSVENRPDIPTQENDSEIK